MIAHRQAKMRSRPACRLRTPLSRFPLPALAPLFYAVCEPLLLIDSDLVLRAVNAAACDLLERHPRDLCGRPWRDAFMLERQLARDWRPNPLLQALATGCDQELTHDTHLICGNKRVGIRGKVLAINAGTQRLALLCLEPSGSTSESASVIARSENELLLQHLSRLNTVSELATGIAHEIN